MHKRSLKRRGQAARVIAQSGFERNRTARAIPLCFQQAAAFRHVDANATGRLAPLRYFFNGPLLLNVDRALVCRFTQNALRHGSGYRRPSNHDLPTKAHRSAVRQLYPHSLSYQLRTFAMRPSSPITWVKSAAKTLLCESPMTSVETIGSSV